MFQRTVMIAAARPKALAAATKTHRQASFEPRLRQTVAVATLREREPPLWTAPALAARQLSRIAARRGRRLRREEMQCLAIDAALSARPAHARARLGVRLEQRAAQLVKLARA